MSEGYGPTSSRVVFGERLKIQTTEGQEKQGTLWGLGYRFLGFCVLGV